MHIKAKPQKPAIVAILGILGVICVVNYRWDIVGFEFGDKLKIFVQDVLREEKFARVKKDNFIINSTATVTLDSAVTVLEIEESEDIVKSTPVPEKTLQNLEDFIYYLAQTKALNQYSFDDWYYKGAGEFLDGKYDEAIISFKKALETKPDKEPAAYTYNYIGASFRNLGNDTEALKNYTESIRLKPNNPLPFINRGGVYHRSGQKDKAYEDLNMAKGLIEIEEINLEAKAFYNKLIGILENNLKNN